MSQHHIRSTYLICLEVEIDSQNVTALEYERGGRLRAGVGDEAGEVTQQAGAGTDVVCPLLRPQDHKGILYCGV